MALKKLNWFFPAVSILFSTQLGMSEKAYSFSGTFGACGTSCMMTGIPNGMMGRSMGPFFGTPFYPMMYSNPYAIGQIPVFNPLTSWNGGFGPPMFVEPPMPMMMGNPAGGWAGRAF